MSMVCTGYKQVGKGVVLGYASIFVEKWGVEIFNITVFQKDGKRWISFPTREYEDEDGKKKYIPHIRFKNSVHMDLFTTKALAYIEKHCGEHPRSDSIFDQQGPF